MPDKQPNEEAIEKMWNIVIICHGGCGKTTNDVSPTEFWRGKVEQVENTLVPIWTCKECIANAGYRLYSPPKDKVEAIANILKQHERRIVKVAPHDEEEAKRRRNIRYETAHELASLFSPPELKVLTRLEAKERLCGGCTGTSISGSYFNTDCKGEALKCGRLNDFIRGVQVQRDADQQRIKHE